MTVMKKDAIQKRISAMFCAFLTMFMVIGMVSDSFALVSHAYSPRTTAPSKDNQYYYSSLNPFYPKYGLPNCTCYAYGRAYEILGYDPKLPTGNAGNWYNNDKTHSKGSTPRLGAIACWKGVAGSDYNGHVAVVEAINGSKISFSESNWGGDLFRYQQNINPNTYGANAPYNYTFQGYIYLDVPVTTYNPGSLAGTYYMKNNSTGTYAYLNGSDANTTDIALGAKKTTAAYQMIFTKASSSDAQKGVFIRPAASSSRVVNPYADSPTNGTNVNLYDKSSDGTQQWVLEKVSNGYVIRNYYNNSLVLTANGSTVKVNTYSGAATQIWTLEDATAVPVTLSSIAVNAGTVGTIYENGSTFNPDGMTLTATYSDGTTKTITSGYTIDTVSFATTGQKSVTVNYGGKSAPLEVYVQDLFEGSGTEEDPYQIATTADLMNLASSINNTNANPCYGTAHYIQTANIDLSGIDWTPIGIFYESPSSDTLTNFAAFKGVYDGNYKKITNLMVDYDRNYAGLFGKTNHAVIHSLDVSGEVTGSGVCVGGIVGELSYDSLICYCNFSGRVNGADCVGGLVGKIRGGSTIESCYANAYVIAAGENSTAGGIVGYDQTGFSENCTDTICAANYFAGSVGGTVTGGISGTSENGTAKECTVTFVNNYYLNSAASGAIAGEADTGCMPLIASQLKTIAEDLAEPFVTNKSDAKNDGYPLFYWQQVAEVVYGDTNQDSHVTIVDVIMLNKYVMGAEPLDEFQLEASDVDLNGKADASDSLIILKSLVDLIEFLPLV